MITVVQGEYMYAQAKRKWALGCKKFSVDRRGGHGGDLNPDF